MVSHNSSSKLLKLEKNKDSDRFVLSGRIEEEKYGIRGRCYSQPIDFVLKCLTQDLGNYSQKDKNYQRGEQTVNLVLAALNAIPTINAYSTPWNSLADVGFTWDIVLTWKENIFPVQIKSSSEGVKEAINNYWGESYAMELMNRYLEAFENLTNKEDINNNKYQIKLLKKSKPIYIWSSHDVENISKLAKKFAQAFDIHNDFNHHIQRAKDLYLSKYGNRSRMTNQRRRRRRRNIVAIPDKDDKFDSFS